MHSKITQVLLLGRSSCVKIVSLLLIVECLISSISSYSPREAASSGIVIRGAQGQETKIAPLFSFGLYN